MKYEQRYIQLQRASPGKGRPVRPRALYIMPVQKWGGVLYFVITCKPVNKIGMVVVDVEASGTEYHKHSIVSIGGLDFDNPTNQFYDECRIWDGAHIMDEAMEVNGFTKEEITDPNKKSEAEIVRAFIVWALDIEEHTLAGQNVSFDRDFLKAAAERAGHTDWPFAYRTIDTHTLAYMHIVKRGLNPPIANNRSALDLDAVLQYVGLHKEPEPHNALTGTLSHAEVISRLLYDRQLLDEFKEYPIPWQK